MTPFDPDPLTPDVLDAKSLADQDLFPPELRQVVADIVAELRNDGDNPSEFYAKIDMGSAPILAVVHLYHQSQFTQNAWWGNPGGEGRDFVYDFRLRKVTKKIARQ